MEKETQLNILYDANFHIQAFNKSKRGSIWKESVQKYEKDLLKNTNKKIKELKSGIYDQKPFNEFLYHDRGKTRTIKAVPIEDRVVLRSLCDNILSPNIGKYLIYDNGASVKNKGISFTRKRLETHLHKYYRKYGSNDGYILLIDFSKFFDNVNHDKLIKEFEQRIEDKEVINFISKVIETFKIDVSFLDEKEYKFCIQTIFNSLEYYKINRELLTKEKFMAKSIGIGSQISQISGLLYPTKIDNYCKIVKGIKYYGRYMDDIYIIHNDKNFLKELLKEINEICKEYGIFINEKKTQIIKLSRPFTFLKVRYRFTDSGKIIKKISRDTIAREKKKLKKFKVMLENNEISFKEVNNQYTAWKGNLKNYNSYYVIKNMDNLFNELFIIPFINKKGE